MLIEVNSFLWWKENCFNFIKEGEKKKKIFQWAKENTFDFWFYCECKFGDLGFLLNVFVLGESSVEVDGAELGIQRFLHRSLLIASHWVYSYVYVDFLYVDCVIDVLWIEVNILRFVAWLPWLVFNPALAVMMENLKVDPSSEVVDSNLVWLVGCSIYVLCVLFLSSPFTLSVVDPDMIFISYCLST